MSKPRSTTSSEAGSVQPAMFVYRVDEVARRLALSDGSPRWQYPCGLCNGHLVTEPGALCSVCAPDAPRSRRKTAKRTRKAPAKKTPAPVESEESSGRSRAKRTPPWERVASQDGGAS
jgi:hypothetical protein